MPHSTSLPLTPPGEFFMDGMEIGTSINAITGERAQSAIDPSTINKEQFTSKDAGEHFHFKRIQDVRTDESSTALGFSSSITFPVDGLNVSSKQGVDFSSTSKSEGATVLYVLEWQRVGKSERLKSDDAKLKKAASDMLATSPKKFGRVYGDYVVYSITTKAKFLAVWKCTANSSSDLQKFQTSLNVAVKGPGDIGGEGGFESSLSKAASQYSISVEVTYDTVGDAGDIRYDLEDVSKTFESFQKNCTNVNDIAYFQHYSLLDSRVPTTIDMEPTTFQRLRDVFAKARFVLLLNSIAPGAASTRLVRQEQLVRIFSQIYSNRTHYEEDPNVLNGPLDELDKLRTTLLQRLDRQDLVMSVRSLTYDDIKKLFQVDHENERGAWVAAVEGKADYKFGRTDFSGADAERYAVKTVLADECHMSYKLGGQVVGSLNFPGQSKVHGTAVGVHVKANWDDGTDGYWCIPKENPLGKTAFKIEVKSEGSRGMHWSLHVTYIDSADYDG